LIEGQRPAFSSRPCARKWCRIVQRGDRADNAGLRRVKVVPIAIEAAPGDGDAIPASITRLAVFQAEADVVGKHQPEARLAKIHSIPPAVGLRPHDQLRRTARLPSLWRRRYAMPTGRSARCCVQRGDFVYGRRGAAGNQDRYQDSHDRGARERCSEHWIFRKPCLIGSRNKAIRARLKPGALSYAPREPSTDYS